MLWGGGGAGKLPPWRQQTPLLRCSCWFSLASNERGMRFSRHQKCALLANSRVGKKQLPCESNEKLFAECNLLLAGWCVTYRPTGWTRSFLFNWGQWGCAFLSTASKALAENIYAFVLLPLQENVRLKVCFCCVDEFLRLARSPISSTSYFPIHCPGKCWFDYDQKHVLSPPFAALLPVILLRVPINWMSLPVYLNRDFMKLHRKRINSKKMQLTASQQKF